MGTTCGYDATRHSDVLGSRLDDQKVGVQRIWATIRTQLRDLSGWSHHEQNNPVRKFRPGWENRMLSGGGYA